MFLFLKPLTVPLPTANNFIFPLLSVTENIPMWPKTTLLRERKLIHEKNAELNCIQTDAKLKQSLVQSSTSANPSLFQKDPLLNNPKFYNDKYSTMKPT